MSVNTKGNNAIVQKIWKIDEDISKGIFEMTLPSTVEYVLSIPGNVFGLVPSLLIGPLLIMIVLGEGSPPLTLTIVTCFLTLGYLISWAEFLRGNNWSMKKILSSRVLYMIAPVFSAAMCYIQTSDPLLLSLSIYPSVIWMLSIGITLVAKNTALRERPCVKFHHLIERKHLAAIPTLLAKLGSKGSFPSGDATGVIGFALPLATRYPTVAILMVVVVCFGRMYYLAHHLLDTVAGCAIAYSVHLLLTQLGLGMEDTRLWHPVVALVIFVGVLLSNGKHGYR
jgi:membrane-associated phospholipid phosphatase